MSHNITVESGKAFRLLTSGKYCDRDIIITAEGGKEDLDAVLTEQDNLIDELREVLKSKGSGEAEPVIEPLEVTENGTYTASEEVDGYSPVTVNVPIPDGYIQPSGTKSITANGTHDVTANASVSVNVPIPEGYIQPSGTLTITENGTHDVANYASAVVEVEGSGGGDTSAEDGLIDGTLSGEYTNSRVTVVGSYAFCYKPIESVDFPAVTSIGSNAFQSCSKLTTLNFPLATSIGYATFSGCSGITSVNFPSVSYMNGQAFYKCINLISASFPALTTIGNGVFAGCSKLTTIYFPMVAIIHNGAFESCNALTSASFPAVTTISTNAFYACRKLKTLYLPGSNVCSLTTSTAFTMAGIASSKGSIFVPASLLTTYQTATNWAYFSTQFVPIEE